MTNERKSWNRVWRKLTGVGSSAFADVLSDDMGPHDEKYGPGGSVKIVTEPCKPDERL